jgi:TRAP-type C4-dicarboxylate transport system substrate-binding protein
MKDSKKWHKWPMVLVVGLALAVAMGWAGDNSGGVAFAAKEKPIVLKFAGSEPPVSMYAKKMDWWGNEIEKRTGGRVKIKMYHGSTLAKAPVTLDAVRAKLAQMGTVVSVFHPGKTPLATVSQNPTGSSDIYANLMGMKYLIYNYGPLQKEFAKFNQKALWVYASGAQRLIASKPVEDLSKLKGLKIRATAQKADLVKRLGAHPVFIPMGETYEGLQRGTAEGAVAGLAHMRPLRFYEVCKHLLLFDGIGGACAGFATINLDVWNKLPSDIQAVMIGVSTDFFTVAAKAHIAMEEQILEQFRAAGVSIYQMSPEDKKLLMATGEAVANKWKQEMDAKGLPGTEILDLLLKNLAKDQAEVDAKGYPWARN